MVALLSITSERTKMFNLCTSLSAVVFVGGLLSSFARGQEQSALPELAGENHAAKSTADAAADLELLRAGAQAFAAAFNQGDAKAVAACWTADGEFIDESGSRFAGRDAIQQEYARYFADSPKTQMRIFVDSLRLLSDSAAIEDGRAVVEPPPAGAPGISKYTVVHVKVDGKWLMATVRDAWIATPSAYENVADLDWLIGTWTAEEHGAKTVADCRWVANKSFVERSYTTTHTDGTSASGVLLIGWNPQQGHVQSWMFSSDGGHAVGVWSPRESGWAAEVRGTTGDGVSTRAVNLLTRLDDDAYVWQSVQRFAGDRALADTDEVVIRRKVEP
jgi:uncharacterized protein (TIGR02246 family)